MAFFKKLNYSNPPYGEAVEPKHVFLSNDFVYMNQASIDKFKKSFINQQQKNWVSSSRYVIPLSRNSCLGIYLECFFRIAGLYKTSIAFLIN